MVSVPFEQTMETDSSKWKAAAAAAVFNNCVVCANVQIDNFELFDFPKRCRHQNDFQNVLHYGASVCRVRRLNAKISNSTRIEIFAELSNSSNALCLMDFVEQKRHKYKEGRK